jgi:hypothetical protein
LRNANGYRKRGLATCGRDCFLYGCFRLHVRILAQLVTACNTPASGGKP